MATKKLRLSHAGDEYIARKRYAPNTEYPSRIVIAIIRPSEGQSL